MTFIIRNEAGHTLVDGIYRNLQVTAEGSFQVTQGQWQIFTMSYPSRPATFVCVKIQQDVQYLTGATKATQTKIATSLGNGGIIEWKAVSIAQDGIEGPGGIIVRDASGNTCFTAARKPALVVAYVPGTGLLYSRTLNNYNGGNGVAFNSNADGRPNWTRIRHQDISVQMSTFWSVRQCGSYPRDGANHNFYPFKRTSTTEISYDLTVLSETYVNNLETASFVPESVNILARNGFLVVK